MNGFITNKQRIYKNLFLLIGISAIVRGFLAGFIELGNDEVYYWTYALYPDFSHFDHPPMVGFLIQIFTLDLLLDHEFFIRLGSIILGSVNTWLIYRAGIKIGDEKTGYYAAWLYTASIYCFIITGVFILPDTPQVFFWLLSMNLFLGAFLKQEISSGDKKKLLWAGVFTGLGMLSKYTSAYLWLAVILYVLLFNRKWLKIKELYMSMLISGILFLPVIIWSIQTDFVSFTFHGDRISLSQSGINPDYLVTEVMGQFFYNNPVNVILIITVLYALTVKKFKMEPESRKLLLLFGVPLILTFLFFSLFRKTLPHWSGPGYLSLLLIASSWLKRKKEDEDSRTLPSWIQTSVVLLAVVIILGVGQINFGLFSLSVEPADDPSVEMYGWRSLKEEAGVLFEEDKNSGLMGPNTVIMSHKWFPAAHLDYYIARPLDMKLYAIGPLNDIHKYAWINAKRGDLEKGTDAYFITTSRYYRDPGNLYANLFEDILPPDTINIYRGRKLARRAFFFRMKNLKETYNFGEQPAIHH